MIGWFRKRVINTPELEDLFDGNRYMALARHVVLSQIKAFDGNGIWCDSTKHVRIVVLGSDPLSLYIARQAALVCHYPNFDDEKGCYRTVLTIVDPQSDGRDSVEALKNRFETISGNLLSECIWKGLYLGAKTIEWNGPKTNSFIDLEFEFVGLKSDGVDSFFKNNLNFDCNAIVSIIDNSNLITEQTLSWIESNSYQYNRIEEDRLNDIVKDCRVDVRRAQVINMLYEASGHLDDIYTADINKVAAYKTALEFFCLHTTVKKIQQSWNRIKDVSLKLSSLYCADYIDTKIRCVQAGNCDMKHLNGIELERFTRSEHTRWNVEKLISGYRSYTAQERYDDECLFSDPLAMKAERKRLKTEQHAHVDICSCKELIRVDFGSYKYDCFLTLAADDIVRLGY